MSTALTPLLAALTILMVTLVPWATAAGEINGFIDRDTGRVRIEQNSIKLLHTDLTFWHGEWTWVGLETIPATTGTGSGLRLVGTNREAGLVVSQSFRVTEESSERTRIRLELKVEKQPGGKADVYGGLIFHVDTGDPATSGVTALPVLNQDKSGWRLDLARGPVTVTFDKPQTGLFFERGNPREIRAFLLQRQERRDIAEIGLDIVFPGRMARSLAERLNSAVSSWPVSNVHWNHSPVDLSFLNAGEMPAGKRGFIRASGERLVFADGTETRFWGTNIAAYSLFHYSNPETVRSQARRLSKLGFNLVRIHHHDSTWVDPNIFGRASKQTRQLSAAQLDQIHWWIKCLKDEGIYVWIDLYVGREVTAADGVEAFQELSGGAERGKLHGTLFVNPSLRERLAEFAVDYLSSKSPYTGVALKDDPAVIGILIANENDLTGHFIHPIMKMPWHSKRYFDLARASKAARGMDGSALGRVWENGQVKMVLGDIEHQLFDDITKRLRAIGVKVPIVTGNSWGELPVSSLPSLAAGDFVDVHSYAKSNEIEFDPRYRESSLSWMGAGAVVGKPLTVSEWNIDEPSGKFDRFILPVHIASIARFQGWPALMQYNYSQEPFVGYSKPGGWGAYNDPAVLATLPVAALLYRAGHVKEGVKTTLLQLPLEALVGKRTDPITSRALRTLVERSKLRIGLPELPGLDWHRPTATAPAGAIVVGDVNYDAIGPNTTKVCTDTGEICRDWKAGVLTIDTSRSQIAAGWIGGKSIETGDASFKVNEAAAAIAVQSIGDQAIAEAPEIWISMTAQVLPLVSHKSPYRSEPLTGEISIRARKGLSLYRLGPAGEPQLVPTTYNNGRYAITLRAQDQAHWWVLR